MFKGIPSDRRIYESTLVRQTKMLSYHVVGNYYLKYSWEYFMQNKLHNIFLYSVSKGCFSEEEQPLAETTDGQMSQGQLTLTWVKRANNLSGFKNPNR